MDIKRMEQIAPSLKMGRDQFAGKRVGVTISGGNVSTERFAALMSGAEAAN